MELTFNELPAEVGRLSERLASIERLLHDQATARKTEPNEFLSVDQAAAFLHLTKPTLYSKVSKREIPFCKQNGRLYFSREELLAYVKEGRTKTRQELQEDARIAQKKGSYE